MKLLNHQYHQIIILMYSLMIINLSWNINHYLVMIMMKKIKMKKKVMMIFVMQVIVLLLIDKKDQDIIIQNMKMN